MKSCKHKVRWSVSSDAGWMRHSKLVGKTWTKKTQGMWYVHNFFCFIFGFWQLRNPGRIPFSENWGQLALGGT